MQKNWIGRSEGLLLRFMLDPATAPNEETELEIFTTRPDTLVRRQVHGAVARSSARPCRGGEESEARRFIAQCRHMGTAQAAIDTAEKLGFDTGIKAVHPFDASWQLPVYVANFILMDYGTGAIFGCPAHDQRDLDFVNKYGLGNTPVVCPPGQDPKTFVITDVAYDGDGRMINSRFLDGMTHRASQGRSGQAAGEETRGNRPVAQRQVNYRLRDWGISRQRYWGCPIPIIHCEQCGVVPVPEQDLPVTLPEDVTFDKPGNPLDRHPTWKNVTCPQVRRPGAARDRHHGHLRRLVLVLRALHRSVDHDARRPTCKMRRTSGCRSISISAASSTRSCICSIRASSPAPCARPAMSAWTSRSPACSRKGMVVHETYRSQERRLGGAGRGQDRWHGRRAPRHAGLDRRGRRDRRHRENVEVEEEHGRSRRHHRRLRRRHRALVHAVRLAARARRDLDRGRRAGRLALRAAAVAADRRDRRASPRRPRARPQFGDAGA